MCGRKYFVNCFSVRYKYIFSRFGQRDIVGRFGSRVTSNDCNTPTCTEKPESNIPSFVCEEQIPNNNSAVVLKKSLLRVNLLKFSLISFFFTFIRKLSLQRTFCNRFAFHGFFVMVCCRQTKEITNL